MAIARLAASSAGRGYWLGDGHSTGKFYPLRQIPLAAAAAILAHLLVCMCVLTLFLSIYLLFAIAVALVCIIGTILRRLIAAAVVGIYTHTNSLAFQLASFVAIQREGQLTS